MSISHMKSRKKMLEKINYKVNHQLFQPTVEQYPRFPANMAEILSACAAQRVRNQDRFDYFVDFAAFHHFLNF